MDSGSDDSHRWSDTLSIDEKDGFVFVNYSEGQAKGAPPHPVQSAVHPPLHPPAAEPRPYNQLKAGGGSSPSSLCQWFESSPTPGLSLCVQDTGGSGSWCSAANSPCTRRLTARTTPTPPRSPPSPSPSEALKQEAGENYFLFMFY